MSLESNVRTASVSDALALRALAHPLRLKLHGLVARAGSLTAADAARQLDISHALASHHLRQLAKYHFVEPAEASDSRAHPWRVTATSMAFTHSEPEAWAPTDFIQRHAVEQAAAELAEWQQRRDQADPRWAEPAGAATGLIYLTPEEFTEVMAAWSAILAPLAEKRPVGHAAQRPPDAEPVSFTLIAVPIPRTEQGG